MAAKSQAPEVAISLRDISMQYMRLRHSSMDGVDNLQTFSWRKANRWMRSLDQNRTFPNPVKVYLRRLVH